MSPDEAQRLFMDAGLQDEGTARQQAARGTFDPAYLNYALGQLMIMRLRDDWTRERGGRKAWKAFHDVFLSYGGPPIPLFRAQMLGGAADTRFWRAPAKRHGEAVSRKNPGGKVRSYFSWDFESGQG